jgi:hypothetical protein|tara:strand:+ start:49 stop:348 length:300 start_codon:yes stop_codon:yes gene_type:complete
MAFKLKNEGFKKIIKELRKASKMHAGQADRIEVMAKGPCGKPEGECKCPSSPMTKKGKKDACYHKVKSRVKVWPSAYASGQLVQCRKRGAANWGSKKKS